MSEKGTPTPEASLLERGKEDAYSVEPELHNGCIVELIDLAAHGDEAVPALDFFFIFFSG